MTYGADQLRLPHLRASVDPELRCLAPQLRHGHRARARPGALRGAALARRRLGALAAESAARLPRQLRDRLLPARPGLGLLHVPARRLSLLLGRHLPPPRSAALSSLTRRSALA